MVDSPGRLYTTFFALLRNVLEDTILRTVSSLVPFHSPVRSYLDFHYRDTLIVSRFWSDIHSKAEEAEVCIIHCFGAM